MPREIPANPATTPSLFCEVAPRTMMYAATSTRAAMSTVLNTQFLFALIRLRFSCLIRSRSALNLDICPLMGCLGFVMAGFSLLSVSLDVGWKRASHLMLEQINYVKIRTNKQLDGRQCILRK